MTDKEVGELWRQCCGSQYVHAVEKDLIRKLVEDRQALWWHELAKRPNGTNPREALQYALRDFGIDPEIWKSEVSPRQDP